MLVVVGVVLAQWGACMGILGLCSSMIVLVNRKDLMGTHRVGPVLNLGLALSFLFSIYISYTGCVAIIERVRELWQG